MNTFSLRSALYTVTEAAPIIRVHEVTLRDWIRAGKFPAYRIGRRYRIDPADLEVWLDRRRQEVTKT